MSSVQKALEILKKLGEPPFEYSLTELSRELELTRSNIFKILKDLEEQYFVVKDSSSKKYHIGPINLRLGRVYSNLVGFSEVAKPILINLLSIIGETVYTCIWEVDRVVVLDKETRPGGLYNLEDFIGKTLPVNCGSSGKLLFAYRGYEKTRELIDSVNLPQRTPNTVVDKGILLREYDEIRKKGYSFEDETFDMGVIGLSVPIICRKNQVDFCLSMNATKTPENLEKIPFWIRKLQNGAEDISYKMQFRY